MTLTTYGFSEYHFKDENDNLMVIRQIGANYVRVYRNRELILKYYDYTITDRLVEKYEKEYDLFFMCSEGAEETICHCWKEGLE